MKAQDEKSAVAPAVAKVFPLPGIAWSTSPEYPFHAVDDPDFIVQPSAILTLAPDAPASWLEAALTGPGTFSFSAQSLEDYGADGVYLYFESSADLHH